MGVNIFVDIEKAKKKLVTKAREKGLFEDFGQRECRKLNSKWLRYLEVYDEETDKIIKEELNKFRNWAENFSLEDLREG